MTTKHPLYLSCAETAKQLRQALKEKFPAVKFTVRSHTYAGGASIDVAWTDGPTAKQVEAICNRFEGATFDGMTDSKRSQVHRVNGQDIHYGADYIFPQRSLSVAFLTRVAQTYCRRNRCPMPVILEQSTGACVSRSHPDEVAIMRLAWETEAKTEKQA